MALLALALAIMSPLEARPATQMIAVAPGRSIALHCTGKGDHTVLFDSGGSDWSTVWELVQPRVAQHARACTYDRAGLGESDPARGPRTPAAIAEDIHRLIEVAKLPGPVILVGHSLGGFNVKLTAALYPRDVAGLVLIDPSEERTWDRSRAVLGGRYGTAATARAELADHQFIAALIEHYRRCAEKAAVKPLDLSAPDVRRCADPDRPKLAPASNAERKRIHATSVYQAAQASEVEWSVYGDAGSDPVYAALFRPGMFANKPVVVLTHEEEASEDPVDKLNAAQGLMLHRQSAALSRRGEHRAVANSSHYIQLDQPDIVVAVIDRVLQALEGRATGSAQTKSAFWRPRH
jgi:pimeloyl-ACP methyl ester carboxylesterase